MSDAPLTLVNLTHHPVVLDATAGTSHTGGPANVTQVSIAPEGGLARVNDHLLGDGALTTQHGVLHEIVMRRSQTVEGLPPERPGVAYLVPRLTALAARSRADLVFPHQERRNHEGTVVGARAVGRFEPEATRWRNRRPPAGDSQRRRRDVQYITILLGIAFAAATSLLGSALGIVPDLIANNPHSEDFLLRAITFLVILVLGLVTLYWGGWLWTRRGVILARHGTAYIVDELAQTWTYEEKRNFVSEIGTEFASVLKVPGPADLGQDWRWPLGDGAENWGDKVNELVRALWAVNFNDDQATHNALFVWAWWPVAIALGARATSGRRGFVLRIRQRPSSGREGALGAGGWRQDPHVFVRDPRLETVGGEQPARRARLTITPRPGLPQSPEAATPVTVLLVRMTRGPWGPVTSSPEAPAEPIEFDIDDAAGIGIDGTCDADLLEWRCLAPDNASHEWRTYPALAQSAVQWISDKHATLKGTVLVGMLIPQEIAVGIGVSVAHTPETTWPAHLWPIQYKTPAPVKPDDGHGAANRSTPLVKDRHGGFVIPKLDLGWGSLNGVTRR